MSTIYLTVALVIALTHSNANARTFRFINQCKQTLWIGIQGRPLIVDGGFELPAASTKDIDVPDGWVAGRFWPRTGCRWINKQFKCATGDCGARANGFGIPCKGISGQPPVTLAEFTLNGAGGLDYYDLSNGEPVLIIFPKIITVECSLIVDGHSVGMTIKPIGQFQMVNNKELGKYNCGTATCTFDVNKCPPELQMDDGAGNKVCASICAAINNAGQRAKHQMLQNFYDNKDTRSLVCCSCDRQHCVSPHDKVTAGGKCDVETWPRSSQNIGYDKVFKIPCPDAYSWQFDDFKSTYQCMKANYEIILCPSGDTTSPIVTATATAAIKQQQAQSNSCNGRTFDTNTYDCLDGQLCPKGQQACGKNSHACFKPSQYKCVNGKLQSK
ncbi:unnamed protein product [Didymodactylos carnosus]|uniref:Endo-1,3(4)-beta-glucanase 1 carbohydrate binding domain-containing protein n=2 Tax=Didymodactylos carnosus TaxID=1234261 RepID=A0A815BAS6_9BILA|nr:unnamed protein product [Didymodactylos carnosus]CAF4053400.1 unnamed protein product [Didymodactylos carnosus]